MTTPVPFRISHVDDPKQGPVQVATNGSTFVQLRGGAGRLFARRGLRGVSLKPAAEQVLPLINQFAGELVQNLEMPARDIYTRLHAIAGAMRLEPPEPVEWAVAELDGVRVYIDGVNVVVTREDMQP